MGLNKTLHKIEKKYAWGFLGFIFAALMAIWSIYVTYYRDLNPNLLFIVETNTKVLDLKENVRKLDVLYQGENIKESKKNLSVIKLKFLNPTESNITINSYDQKEPVGFKLEKGEIVEKPEVVDVSSDYLKRNLVFKKDTNGYITFNPVIIEGEDHFTVKFLVLHKNNETPNVVPFGKIAGIKKFEVTDEYKSNGKKSYWEEAFSGRFTIQAGRVVFYIITASIGIFVIVFITVVPIIAINDAITDKRRKRRVRKYKLKRDLKDSEEGDLIFSEYVSFGLNRLLLLQKVINDKESLKRRIGVYNITEAARKTIVPEELDLGEETKMTAIQVLVGNKIVRLENGSLIINQAFVELLDQFISHLKVI